MTWAGQANLASRPREDALEAELPPIQPATGVGGFTHEPPAGGQPDWYTPPGIFRALGLEFDLDPCAPPLPAAHWIPAAKRYSLPADGLALPWKGRVWLNPPYAKETSRWLGRMMAHGNGIALTFTRTDTAWWQAAAAAADAVCFVTGRVTFVEGRPDLRRGARKDSRPGAPSCLLAFGGRCAEAVWLSGLGVTLGSFMVVDRQSELVDPPADPRPPSLRLESRDG